MTDYDACVRRWHPIVDLGGPWFCRVCHEATDASFATWSRDLLAKIKAESAMSPSPLSPPCDAGAGSTL